MFQNLELPKRNGQSVLDHLYEYDDFMQSIATLVDLGCGVGEDLEWWATRTTRDESPIPLDIKCVGVDTIDKLSVARKYPNITYQRQDFEKEVFKPKKGFDVLWCNNAFQYALNPIGTLSNWWHLASDGGMLILIVPQTVLINQRKLAYQQHSGCYYHHTLVSLIHMLSVSGWDCKAGFFQHVTTDPWLHAVVYKSEHAPMDPRSTTWYELSERQLLPDSADRCIRSYGYLKQQDLVLPWLDRSVSSMSQL